MAELDSFYNEERSVRILVFWVDLGKYQGFHHKTLQT